VEKTGGDMKSWNERQTEKGMEDSWKATERGVWGEGGCTWMIVSFMQASAVAN